MPTQTIALCLRGCSSNSADSSPGLQDWKASSGMEPCHEVKTMQSIWLLQESSLTNPRACQPGYTKPSSVLKPEPTSHTPRIGQTKNALKASGASGSLARGTGLLLLCSMLKAFQWCVCVCGHAHGQTPHQQSRVTHAIPETDIPSPGTA